MVNGFSSTPCANPATISAKKQIAKEDPAPSPSPSPFPSPFPAPILTTKSVRERVEVVAIRRLADNTFSDQVAVAYHRERSANAARELINIVQEVAPMDVDVAIEAAAPMDVDVAIEAAAQMDVDVAIDFAAQMDVDVAIEAAAPMDVDVAIDFAAQMDVDNE